MRSWLALPILLVAVVGGLLLWKSAAPRTEPQMQSLLIHPRPFTATIDLSGTIKPGAPISVIAPFDGAVASMHFNYGDAVRAGQALVEMDAFDITQQLRDAQAAYLKAQAVSDNLSRWDASPDVSRARRAKQASELALADTRRKLEETKALLDRGLVARTEYDALAAQLRGEEGNTAAAAEDLAAALKRGRGSNVVVAQLELANARDRWLELRSQGRASGVVAPTSGVIVRPASADSDSEIHVGQRLARGRAIGAIVQPDALAVELLLDEADARRVTSGQVANVSVEGAGQSFHGRVASVAREARPPPAGAGSSTVLARVMIDPSQNGLDSVRVGATANVSVVIREIASAIVVPPNAVRGAPPSGEVLVRNPKTRRTEPRPITLGQSDGAGIEVLSGLNAGETIYWPKP